MGKMNNNFWCISRRFAVIVLLVSVMSQRLLGMVYDNRYMPLLQRSYITCAERPSHVRGALFAMTASQAFGQGDDFLGIPEIYGPFDLGVLTKSMGIAQMPLSPLLSELQDQKIPFRVDGHLQTQGVAFGYQQQLGDLLELGFTWFVMRSTSRQEFFPDRSNMNFGSMLTDITLDEALREALAELGFKQNYAHQVGSSDFDLYARVGYRWDYELKCRSIDTGLRVGLLAPMGVTRCPTMPASIPFGGDGFWGMYGQLDLEVEAKEDFKVGLFARLNKRFAKTKMVRMPVTQEPSIFGVAQGDARINPGVTFIFSPYASIEGLRGGLGLRVDYTLTKHMRDSWSDARPAGCVPVNLCQAEAFSRWGSDYASFTAFYDFGKMKEVRSFEPLLFFTWDIPVSLFVTERSVKTNRVMLGVEFSF